MMLMLIGAPGKCSWCWIRDMMDQSDWSRCFLMLPSSSWCYHRVGTLSPGSSLTDNFFWWTVHLLMETVMKIGQLIAWLSSCVWSAGSWSRDNLWLVASLLKRGPPCSSVQGQPWMSGGPPCSPNGYNQAGGVGGRGRDAGPIAPFVCGYSCQFCQEVCSRNKTNHSHHRCRQHGHLWSKTGRPSFFAFDRLKQEWQTMSGAPSCSMRMQVLIAWVEL